MDGTITASPQCVATLPPKTSRGTASYCMRILQSRPLFYSYIPLSWQPASSLTGCVASWVDAPVTSRQWHDRRGQRCLTERGELVTAFA